MFLLRKLEWSSSEQIQKIIVWSSLLVVFILFGWVIRYFFMNNRMDVTIYSCNLYFLIAFLLMPLNILIESLKLYYKLHSSLSLFQLTRQVCKGFTLGFFFPIGLGPFLGRVLFLKEKNLGEIIRITAVSSLLQTFCNLCFGILLGYPLMKLFMDSSQMAIRISYLFSITGIVFFICGINWMDRTQNSFLFRIKSIVKSKFNYSSTQLSVLDWVVLSGLSFVRYLIYSIQCILIVMSFPGIEIFSAISSVALFFMILSLIYLPGILSVLSRSAISCLVFTSIGLENDQAIYCSCFIFLLNIVVPAMFGMYYLLDDMIQAK